MVRDSWIEYAYIEYSQFSRPGNNEIQSVLRLLSASWDMLGENKKFQQIFKCSTVMVVSWQDLELFSQGNLLYCQSCIVLRDYTVVQCCQCYELQYIFIVFYWQSILYWLSIYHILWMNAKVGQCAFSVNLQETWWGYLLKCIQHVINITGVFVMM